MINSKTAGKQRAFQSLPRELRRRAASHNVKRIPHRLRDRATNEMKDDNKPPIPPKSKKLRGYLRVKQKAISQKLQASKKKLEEEISKETKEKDTDFSLDKYVAPTAKFNKSAVNALAVAPMGKVKFQHRQLKKTWLPTHVWHAKRAHFEDKWGYRIVTEPSLKCYRATHRTSTQSGAIAWDCSYYATFVLVATQEVLKKVLALMTANIFSEKYAEVSGTFNYEKVVEGNRSWEGILFDENGAPLGPTLVVWQKTSKDSNTHRALLRFHPCITIRVVNLLNSLKKSFEFCYNDFRYLIGSIDIVGPASTQALASVLKIKPSSQEADSVLSKIWNRLGNVVNIQSLPSNFVVSLDNVADPRLSYPPRYNPDKNPTYDGIEMVTSWPDDIFVSTSKGDTENHGLFNEASINKSYVNQPTQKNIDSRRAKLTEVDINREKIPFLESDPTFPVLLIKRQDSDTLTLMMPWGWVMPVWYCLQHHSNVRIGGLKQRNQLNFESNRLTFPDDYPGTIPGALNEELEAEKTRLKWARKPKAKRLSYRRVSVHGKGNAKGEIGSPFRCDWKYLWKMHQSGNTDIELQDPQDVETLYKDDEKLAKAILTKHKEHTKTTSVAEARKYLLKEGQDSKNETEKEVDGNMQDVDEEVTQQEEISVSKESQQAGSLKFIDTILLEESSRIPHRYVTYGAYEASTALPQNGNIKPLLITAVRLECIHKGTPEKNARIYKLPSGSKLRDRWLQLLKRNNPHMVSTDAEGNDLKHGNDPELHVNKEDLIGYVTNGAFNLKSAFGTGVGAIVASHTQDQSQGYCIVRNVGSAIGRLAIWETIPLI